MSTSHPLGPRVRDLCRLYPLQSSAIFQTFLDLTLAQAWQDIEPVQLERIDDDNHENNLRAVLFRGTKPSSPSSTIEYVLPVPLHQPLSLD
ncbi:hypothetical protein OIV83_005006 [Microbotryomycetes sp. JL201]|nr:hypothetical protein OIV83_005006 [Microbotryomycetes sp. JL201]